ncbi:MAG: glycoside hydrolase family 43 protein [Kiritimatiellae bacterium]|nr:glycoside hydrolase family 43 protein [Kiritimatiellia bacterium]
MTFAAGAILCAIATAHVHDPSVFKDRDGRYYIVGTHLASAESANLISWRQTDTLRKAMPPETLAKIRSWNKDGGRGDGIGYMWAPDIVWNAKMRKYCIYLSANGDDWKSNIVLLAADRFAGPYEYVGSVVYGGFSPQDWTETDVPAVLGTATLPDRYVRHGVANRGWGPVFPNCIDPCVFFDAAGRLWMTYGSWSGGIFMLKLDASTGLRDKRVNYPLSPHSDPYFGRKIAGGAYVSGEGSYIKRIGGWYWLFMSYGELKAKGGYNIRVFRSRRPEGPYLDKAGRTPFYDRYVQNFNDCAGVRLFGAYRWGETGPGMVAQGHNSAIVDSDGRAYIVYHTRMDTGHEGHYVRVHQLFTTREGWLVAAPYRTRGERLPKSGLDRRLFAGDWDLMLHRLDVDYANGGGARPVRVKFNADGSIAGAKTGRWRVSKGSPYVTVTLDGEDSFSGVALIMAIDETDLKTPVFTALGDKTQLALWGSKVP